MHTGVPIAVLPAGHPYHPTVAAKLRLLLSFDPALHVQNTASLSAVQPVMANAQFSNKRAAKKVAAGAFRF